VNNSKNYFKAINKTKYRNKVEIIAKAERGKTNPVLSHLNNLIFLLTTFAIYLNRININILRANAYI